MHHIRLAFAATALLAASSLVVDAAPFPSPPRATDDQTLRMPTDYRQWVYLTTGFDMSYSASTTADHHMFDNVFVDPAAYHAFRETGTWPDKTMLVLEVRGTGSRPSINRAGHFQDTAVMGVEVHVKDRARFPGTWAFFAFDPGQTTATMIPRSADCYSCHARHGAVDTTFVQFYPTLSPIAARKGTLHRADDHPGGD